jgi:hypothetical protein
MVCKYGEYNTKLSSFVRKYGAGEWTRTTDLLITNYESHASGPSATVRRRSPRTDLAGELDL